MMYGENLATLFKRGNTWYITDGSGSARKRIKIGPVNRATAEMILREYINRSAMNRFGLDYTKYSYTLDEFSREYEKHSHPRLADQSFRRLLQVMGHLIRFISDPGFMIQALDERICERYVTSRLSSGAAPKTVNLELTMLSGMWEYAVNARYVPANPWKNIRRLKADSNHTLEFTHEQLRFLFSCDDAYVPYWKVLFYTGLRRGDVAGLKKANLREQDHVIVLKTQKTGSAVEIPAHPEIWFLWDIDRDPLFSDHPESFAKKSYDVLKKIIIAQGWNPDLNIHSFRVSFNNQLRNLGISMEDRAILLTHSSTKTTAEYTRSNLGMAREMIEKISVM